MRTPNPSTVLAALALVAPVVGGTAYAAAKLAPGSVTSREIRDGSIRARDLAPSARPLDRIATRAVVEDVIADPTKNLTIKVQGERGEKGDAGPQGPQGPAGQNGQDGVTGATVRTSTRSIRAGYSAGVVATCNPGEIAVGGGARMEGGEIDSALIQGTAPTSDATGWETAVRNAGAADATLVGYAVCIPRR